MISKKIIAIILVAAVVVSLGAVGAYLLLNDDPVELEYKDSFAVGDYQTYEVKANWGGVIEVVSIDGGSMVVAVMGYEVPMDYNELVDAFDEVKADMDAGSLGGGYDDVDVKFSGSLLKADGTIKPESDIKVGDKVNVIGSYKQTFRIESVSSDSVMYTLEGESIPFIYDEVIDLVNAYFDPEYLTKDGSETVKSGLGDVECDIYKDDDGYKYYVHNGVVVKMTMDSDGMTIETLLKDSTMLEVD